MSTWLELRCELRDTPAANHTVISEKRCESHDNAGPMIMSGDSTSDIQQALRHLRIQAKNSGWRRMRKGWVCPHCIKASKGE